MMTMSLDRDALYYPYIEIQSANWLKSTLLSFPHVHRIVPGGYWPNDNIIIRQFLNKEGIGGRPLLINEAPDGQSSIAEQERLARRIERHLGIFRG